jgi:hypothetical protein
MLNTEERSGLLTKPRLLRILRAGLLTGISDGLFASISNVAFYHSSVERLFQGVASVLLGPDALKGGTTTMLIGILMHFGVAFGWSIVFSLIVMRAAWVRKLLASRYGVAKVAALYGPFIWLTMSLVVIPLLVRRPPAITFRWWTQLAGHFPFVGLPMVSSIARDE